MNQTAAARPANGSAGRRGRNDRDPAVRESGDFRRDAGFREGGFRGGAPDTAGAWSEPPRSNQQKGFGAAGGGGVQSSGASPSNRAAGHERGDKALAERPLHDKLLFMTMCLIGQTVEVQVKNGCVYQGIFHAANAERDFGVVLKMARLVKEASKGSKGDVTKDAARNPPMKTLIIHAKDFVQIIAKDVPLSGEASSNGRPLDSSADVITDTELSWRRSSNEGRELTPWKPEEGEEGGAHLLLDSTFSSWGGGGSGRRSSWDQFATNKQLFGVETTFKEEFYTTKLERGSDAASRQREREAERIAREIERSDTRNVHLMEERGQRLAPEIEALGEEERFSSVLRAEGVDAGVGEDEHDVGIDARNADTFGGGGDEVAEAGPSDAVSNGPKKGPEGGVQRTLSADKGGLGDQDPKEHLRLKLDSKGKRPAKSGVVSPYSSPVARGRTPLVGDPTIQNLNLDPSTPQIPDEVYREFQEFKKKESEKVGKEKRAADTEDLKQFAQSLRTKQAPISSATSAPAAFDTPPSSSSTPKQPSTPPTAKPTAPPAAGPKAPPSAGATVKSTPPTSRPGSASASRPGSAGPKPVATKGPPENKGSPVTSPPRAGGGAAAGGGAKKVPNVVVGPGGGPSVAGPTLGSSPTAGKAAAAVAAAAAATSAPAPVVVEGVPSPKPVVKSKLNPNAKEFKLNPNAAVFNPSLAAAPRPMVPMVLPAAQQMPPQMYAGGMQGGPMAMGPGGQFIAGQQFNHYAAMQQAASMGGYAMPPGAFVTPAGAIPPGAMATGQPAAKMQPNNAQQQMVPGQFAQQGMRFPPQGIPMQGGPYMYPGGQQFPQGGVVYGPQGQMLYMPMMQQPMPIPQQMASPPQQQQPPPQGAQKGRGGQSPQQQTPMQFGAGALIPAAPLPPAVAQQMPSHQYPHHMPPQSGAPAGHGPSVSSPAKEGGGK